MASIRFATYAEINGQEQWVTIRGCDTDNPALLVIGGPGGALSAMASFFAPWESAFTLIQWDQPGAGSTFARHGEAGLEPYTLERLTRDAIAVATFTTRYLRSEKLIVLGFSGGSIIGLELASRRPDLLTACVGCGQIVHWARQTRIGYRRLLAEARSANDSESLAELERIGPPPWPALEDEIVSAKYTTAPTEVEQAALASLDPTVLAEMQSPPADADYVADGVEIGDQRAHATAIYAKVRDEIAGFDAWQLGTRFQVPMFFIQGELDTMTAITEVERYVRDLSAPQATLIRIPGAGHMVFYLRDELLRLLEDEVLGYLNRR